MNQFSKQISEITRALNEAEEFITKKTSEDPKHSSTTWVVDYQPNMKKLYIEIDYIVKQIEKLQRRTQTQESETLLKFAKTLRNRYSRLLKKYNNLKEQSSTSQGGASFTPGEGANYATPNAFKKGKNNKTKYYYKLGYKSVPKTTPKSFDKRELWEKEQINELNEFQEKRLKSLDDIEELLNDISPLISNEKNKTIELYSSDVGSYDINTPIEIVKSYLTDIKKILTKE